MEIKLEDWDYLSGVLLAERGFLRQEQEATQRGIIAEVIYRPLDIAKLIRESNIHEILYHDLNLRNKFFFPGSSIEVL